MCLHLKFEPPFVFLIKYVSCLISFNILILFVPPGYGPFPLVISHSLKSIAMYKNLYISNKWSVVAYFLAKYLFSSFLAYKKLGWHYMTVMNCSCTFLVREAYKGDMDLDKVVKV